MVSIMEPIKIDFSGAFAESVGNEHGITKDELKETLVKASDIRLDFPFLKLPQDKKTIADIHKTAEAVRCRFQNMVVLGIGGSALGLRSLARALLPPYFNLLDSKTREGVPRLFVCDNIDPDYFGALLKITDWKATCVNVVSKSGKTTETMAQFYIIKDILIKKLGARRWKEHIIITTDPASGPLRAIAMQEGIQSFSVPQDVGGRFSVFSPVGLLPAACVGIDINGLLAGAADMIDKCKTTAGENNPAILNGCIHYLMDVKKKKPISIMMSYSDSLSSFADWYAQLWAESLGKNGVGPTPIKATGVTDQHSQLQLYMEGPNNKIITILGIDKFRTQVPIPANTVKEFAYLGGRDLGEVIHAEQSATIRALQQVGRPVIIITLPEISSCTIGQILMLYQIQTAITGRLYGINPFDQPGVELSKKLTREILSKPSI